MWRQTQRLNLGNKEYDDILTLLLKDIAKKEIQESNVLLKTEPEHHFSPLFEERMKKRIMQVEANLQQTKQKQTILKWVAIFFLFLLFAFFTFYFNDQELQAKIRNFLFQTKENYQVWDTTIQTTTSTSPQEEAMMWLEQEPGYIPEGYELTERLESFSSILYLYENKEQQSFSIGIALIEHPEEESFTGGELYAFDLEHSTERHIEQDGKQFTFFESTSPEDGNPSFLFYLFPQGGGYVYLSGVLEWEEFYHVFTELEP